MSERQIELLKRIRQIEIELTDMPMNNYEVRKKISEMMLLTDLFLNKDRFINQ